MAQALNRGIQEYPSNRLIRPSPRPTPRNPLAPVVAFSNKPPVDTQDCKAGDRRRFKPHRLLVSSLSSADGFSDDGVVRAKQTEHKKRIVDAITLSLLKYHIHDKQTRGKINIPKNALQNNRLRNSIQNPIQHNQTPKSRSIRPQIQLNETQIGNYRSNNQIQLNRIQSRKIEHRHPSQSRPVRIFHPGVFGTQQRGTSNAPQQNRIAHNRNDRSQNPTSRHYVPVYESSPVQFRTLVECPDRMEQSRFYSPVEYTAVSKVTPKLSIPILPLHFISSPVVSSRIQIMDSPKRKIKRSSIPLGLNLQPVLDVDSHRDHRSETGNETELGHRTRLGHETELGHGTRLGPLREYCSPRELGRDGRESSPIIREKVVQFLPTPPISTGNSSVRSWNSFDSMRVMEITPGDDQSDQPVTSLDISPISSYPITPLSSPSSNGGRSNDCLCRSSSIRMGQPVHRNRVAQLDRPRTNWRTESIEPAAKNAEDCLRKEDAEERNAQRGDTKKKDAEKEDMKERADEYLKKKKVRKTKRKCSHIGDHSLLDPTFEQTAGSLLLVNGMDECTAHHFTDAETQHHRSSENQIGTQHHRSSENQIGTQHPGIDEDVVALYAVSDRSGVTAGPISEAIRGNELVGDDDEQLVIGGRIMDRMAGFGNEEENKGNERGSKERCKMGDQTQSMISSFSSTGSLHDVALSLSRSDSSVFGGELSSRLNQLEWLLRTYKKKNAMLSRRARRRESKKRRAFRSASGTSQKHDDGDWKNVDGEIPSRATVLFENSPTSFGLYSNVDSDISTSDACQTLHRTGAMATPWGFWQPLASDQTGALLPFGMAQQLASHRLSVLEAEVKNLRELSGRLRGSLEHIGMEAGRAREIEQEKNGLQQLLSITTRQAATVCAQNRRLTRQHQNVSEANQALAYKLVAMRKEKDEAQMRFRRFCEYLESLSEGLTVGVLNDENNSSSTERLLSGTSFSSIKDRSRSISKLERQPRC